MTLKYLCIFKIFLMAAVADPYEIGPKETLANYNSTILPSPNVCGLPTILVESGRNFPHHFIVTYLNNSETIQGEFPWLAGLEYNKNGGIKCGGFLINNKYVLTAAHCLNETEYKLIRVWLGMWKQSTVENEDANKVKKMEIEEKIRHESFTTAAHGHDIALIRLNKNVIFTDYIVPICLPKPNLATPPLGSYMTVAGWGYVTESGPTSNILLKVDVPIVENNRCVAIFKVPIADHQLCVGGREGIDSCNGDSGGPLMVNFTNEDGKVQWYPQGIVSFGHGCGRAGYPAVYTRVSKYMDWILSKLR